MSPVRVRALGVTEAMVAARDECPNASVRAAAAEALRRVRAEGAGVLHEQAFLVLASVAGWRGERAEQVKAALRGFLDAPAPPRGGRTPERP